MEAVSIVMKHQHVATPHVSMDLAAYMLAQKQPPPCTHNYTVHQKSVYTFQNKMKPLSNKVKISVGLNNRHEILCRTSTVFAK